MPGTFRTIQSHFRLTTADLTKQESFLLIVGLNNSIGVINNNGANVGGYNLGTPAQVVVQCASWVLSLQPPLPPDSGTP